jgi:hypothetical protein
MSFLPRAGPTGAATVEEARTLRSPPAGAAAERGRGDVGWGGSAVRAAARTAKLVALSAAASGASCACVSALICSLTGGGPSTPDSVDLADGVGATWMGDVWCVVEGLRGQPTSWSVHSAKDSEW